MLTFQDCIFSAKGANKNAKVYGLVLDGADDVLVDSCTFDGTGYSAVLNKTTGKLTVKNSDFKCDNIKNPIEGAQNVENDDVTVEGCEFTGVPGNNFINFYSVKAGSTHTISKCKFAGGTGNNVIRLSNKTNSAATFNVSDCEYKFVTGKADDYTGFLLCQDYTNKSGNKQNFSNYAVRITGLTRPQEGSLYYVYDDGAGIITDNDPYVYLDGELVSKPIVGE